MKKTRFLVAVALLVSLLAASSVSAAVTLPKGWGNYEVVTIDPYFQAFCLNNSGAVGGTLRTYLSGGEFGSEAAIWKNGEITRFPNFGLNASVLDLNDKGFALIEVNDSTPTRLIIADSDGAFIAQVDSTVITVVRKMNNQNQLVGWWTLHGYPWTTKGTIWSQTYNMQVGTSKNYCTFESINNFGQAIGYADLPDRADRTPILWDNGITPIKTPADKGGVSDINDRGWIVGNYGNDPTNTTPNDFFPALWVDKQFYALEDLGMPGFAWRINLRDQIVGFLNNESVIWKTPRGKPVFLKQLSAVKVDRLIDFNDVGQILVAGWLNSQYGCYILQQPPTAFRKIMLNAQQSN